MPPPVRAAAAFGIAYRDETEADYAFVAGLYVSAREAELAATGWPDEARRAFLLQQHELQHRQYRAAWPDGEWLVVERDGAPVGRLYLARVEGGVRIVDVALVPECRGAGIGGAILSDVIDAADTAGESVMLQVERTNPAARLYLRLGFEPDDRGGMYVAMVRRPGGRGQ